MFFFADDPPPVNGPVLLLWCNCALPRRDLLRRPAACVRLSKRRQLKVPVSEGARLKTRWASENRLNRGVVEAISEVVFAERRNRTGAEGFFGDKKNPKHRRVRSDQRRRVKCSQSAMKPLDLLSVRRSGESSDGEDCQSDPVQSQQGILGWGSWNRAVAGADGEEQFCFVVLLRGVMFGKQRISVLGRVFGWSCRRLSHRSCRGVAGVGAKKKVQKRRIWDFPGKKRNPDTSSVWPTTVGARGPQ
ncbi:hypothetical protein U1Q18_006239 [Sarracenia purpurea var. burkii]